MKKNISEDLRKDSCDFVSIFFLFNAFIKYSENVYNSLLKQVPCEYISFDYAWIIVFMYSLKKTTISQLCLMSSKNQPTLSKEINALVKKELVTKQKEGKNVWLSLTDKGIAVFKHLCYVFAKQSQILNKKIDKKDLDQAKKLLEKIVEDINKKF